MWTWGTACGREDMGGSVRGGSTRPLSARSDVPASGRPVPCEAPAFNPGARYLQIKVTKRK
jgi:hypothetical protein